jgi:uncharacterized protein YjiS (DUF1127 family)
MPPQQTKLTSEMGRDTASVAALRDAFSEEEAAGPPVESTWRVWLKRYWRAFRKWRQRDSLRVSLHDLSDKELMDIGLTPSEIDYIDAGRAIERLRDGMMHL